MPPWSTDALAFTATFKTGESIHLFADATANTPGVFIPWGIDVLFRTAFGVSLPSDVVDASLIAEVALRTLGIHPLLDLGKAVYGLHFFEAADAIFSLVNEPAFEGLVLAIEAKLGKSIRTPGAYRYYKIIKQSVSVYRLIAESFLYPDWAYLSVQGVGSSSPPGGPTMSWITAPPETMTVGTDYRVVWQINGGSTVSRTDVRWDTVAPKDTSRCSGASDPTCLTANKAAGGLPASSSALIRAPGVNTDTVYRYVAQAVVDGATVWSPEVSATVRPRPSPTISSVSPSQLPGVPLPRAQLLKILGTGFTPSTRLTFSRGTEAYPNRYPHYVNSTELQYRIAVGNATANWTVKADNGSVSSSSYPFSVTAITDVVAPVVSIVSPVRTGETHSTSATSISVAGVAEDQVGLASLTWATSHGDAGIVSVEQTWLASAIPVRPGANVITVQATDGAGNSSGASITVNVVDVPNPPPPASSLQSIVVTRGSYTVSWSTVGATYVLEEDISGTFARPTRLTTASTSLSFDGKTPGVYFYRVSAMNAGTSGPFSAVKTAVVRHNQRPGVISATSPPDGSTGRSLSVTLSWTATHSDDESLSFDVYYVPADTDIFFPANIVSRGQTTKPGFPIWLWYLTASTSRRALISGVPTQGTPPRRVTPCG